MDTTLRNGTQVKSSAFGFVYFDDGGDSAKKNVSVTDLTYFVEGKGEATLRFDTSGDGYTNPKAINEYCGNITIFNPMGKADHKGVKSVSATVKAKKGTEKVEL